MNKVLVAAVACVSFGMASQALAADLPVKAPPAAVAPAYIWSGLYVGGHIGYGWGRAEGTNVNGNAPFPEGTVSRTDLSGWLGGVQAGWNYQFSPNWLAGIEGEYSWANIDGDHSAFSVVPPFTTTRLSDSHTNIKDIATVTGRLGYVMGSSLFYVKGGGAWAKKDFNSTTTDPTVPVVRTLVSAT